MAETGRRLTVKVTEEMLKAGARALVFDHASDDRDVARRVLFAALNAGRYKVQEGQLYT